jgi:hypothetical protein
MNSNYWGLGIGDWGLGIGDWGLGPIPNPQSPIPRIKIPKDPKDYKISRFYFSIFGKSNLPQ